MTGQPFRVRKAGRQDEAGLRAMQARSFRVLGRTHYRLHQIEAFIAHVGTIDVALLDEGHYFVIESEGGIVASGGWSLMAPGYAALSAEGAARPVEPLVRAVYVRPDAARLGLGRWIMRTVEADIRAAGHGAATLTALLSAVAFYRRLGFHPTGEAMLALPGGLTLPGTHMRKVLAAVAPRSRAA